MAEQKYGSVGEFFASLPDHLYFAMEDPPTIIEIDERELNRLRKIEDCCEKLVDAVTARMGAGEDATDDQVWNMFRAHKEATESLEPNAMLTHTDDNAQ